MEKKLKIRHKGKSFTGRIRYFLISFAGILLIFFLLLLFNEHLQNLTNFIGFFMLPLGGLIGYKIWQTKLYIVDVESDSNIIIFRYYDKKVERNIKSNIKTLEVTLVNTSTRAGFNCELKLRANNKNFVITDTFDWSLSEMKLLFEYIKYFKNEPLTEKEKFKISRIDDKIKKYESQTHYRL